MITYGVSKSKHLISKLLAIPGNVLFYDSGVVHLNFPNQSFAWRKIPWSSRLPHDIMCGSLHRDPDEIRNI